MGCNHIGSTAALTDKTGAKLQGYLYKPYGETWVTETATTMDITRLFTGQQYDQESGLYYMNARYYDPSIGIFMTPDPAMSDLNHYAYAGCNPVMYSDPTGMEWTWLQTLGVVEVVIGAILAIVAAICYFTGNQTAAIVCGSIASSLIVNGACLIAGGSIISFEATIPIGSSGSSSSNGGGNSNGGSNGGENTTSNTESSNGKSNNDVNLPQTERDIVMNNLMDPYNDIRSEELGVYATEDSEVRSFGYEKDGYGNFITLKHPDGQVSLYGHLKEGYKGNIGDKIRGGQQIGEMSNSGGFAGMAKHLHFGLYPKDTGIYPQNAINPTKYLKNHTWPANTYISNGFNTNQYNKNSGLNYHEGIDFGLSLIPGWRYGLKNNFYTH